MKYKDEYEQYITKNGTYRINKITYYLKICEVCGCISLVEKNGKYCSLKCSSSIKRFHTEKTKQKMRDLKLGKKLSEEHRKKLSKAQKISQVGKKLSEETKKRIGLSNSGENNYNWKGGVWKLNIPLYDTYVHQLEPIEQCRKTEEGYLEVKCTYCGRWYQPKKDSLKSRIYAMNNIKNGENRLYCSSFCKSNCPIYGRVKYEMGYKPTTSREVQPELRKLVFQRDNWTCIKCGTNTNLHCHHIEGLKHNPIESADIDLCITLCKNCHKEVHKQKDCKYYNLRCK